MRTIHASALALAVVAIVDAQAPAMDWPQWRGPNRDGVSREIGLARDWPPGGPPLLWTATGLGAGYGTVAVAHNRIYVQSLRNNRSMVHAIDGANGRYLWSKNLGPGVTNDRGPGPRGTPTIDGDRLYVLTEAGDLACLLTRDATVVWQRNILRDFNGRNINWLISESPLVDGDRVIVTPGGPKSGIVALDKMTGSTIWVSEGITDQAGYSSPVVVDVQGIRAYTTIMASAAIGVRASDGRVLWKYPGPANYTANIATPLVSGSQVFYSSAYGTGGGLLNLRSVNGEVRAEEVYFTRDMQNHHGGVILVDGVLYGFNNGFSPPSTSSPAGRCGGTAASAREPLPTRMDGCTSSAKTTWWVSRKSAPRDIARRAVFKLPIRGFPHGLTRSSAEDACFFVIRTFWPCTTSKRADSTPFESRAGRVRVEADRLDTGNPSRTVRGCARTGAARRADSDAHGDRDRAEGTCRRADASGQRDAGR
jgi:outer membrane protein assembly factor BamB